MSLGELRFSPHNGESVLKSLVALLIRLLLTRFGPRNGESVLKLMKELTKALKLRFQSPHWWTSMMQCIVDA